MQLLNALTSQYAAIMQVLNAETPSSEEASRRSELA
jgi:hypothetical protein